MNLDLQNKDLTDLFFFLPEDQVMPDWIFPTRPPTLQILSRSHNFLITLSLLYLLHYRQMRKAPINIQRNDLLLRSIVPILSPYQEVAIPILLYWDVRHAAKRISALDKWTRTPEIQS